MPRLPRPRKRFVCLVAFAFLLAALLAPGLLPAGAQSTVSDPAPLPGEWEMQPAAGRQRAPQISKGADSYLAVWTDGRTSIADENGFAVSDGDMGVASGLGSLNDVYAARVGADGQVIDRTPIVVAQEQHTQDFPRVGWNGQNWLVVWFNKRPRDQYSHTYDVVARRVTPGGTVLDPEPILLRADVAQGEWPREVIEDGAGNWVVAWQGTIADDPLLSLGVFVARVANDGSVLDPGGRLVYNHRSRNMSDVAIARAGDLYLVTFIAMGPPYRVMGLLLNSDFVQTRNGPEEYAADGYRPRVASNGSTWLVVYGDNIQAVKGVRVNRLGDKDGSAFNVANVGASILPEAAATWDGSNWLVAYNSGFDQATGTYIQGGDDLFVTRVTAAGVVLDAAGRPVKRAPGHQGGASIAAGFAGGARVVWHDLGNFDVYTAGVTAAGQASPDAVLGLGAPRQSEVRIAAGSGGFLAVFKSEVSTRSRILGQHLDAQGNAVEAEPFVIAESGNNPSVAWNGSTYLVVWDSGNNTYGRAVPATGAPASAATLLMPGVTPDAAAVPGGQFLVANILQETSQIRSTQAVRVGGFGEVVGTPVKIQRAFNFVPRVAAVGNRWLVVWEFHSRHDGAPGTIYATFFEQAGTFSTPFIVGNIANDQTPHLAVSNDSTALVVWQTSGNLYGRRVNADGTSPDPVTGVALVDAPEWQGQPAVAWDGNQYVVTWIDQRNAPFPAQPRGDVYAARVSKTNVKLEEFALADSQLPEETPFVAAGGGLTVFAYARFYDNAPSPTWPALASHRITLRTAAFGPPDVGGAPAAPTGLVASQVNTVGGVTLTWVDASDNETGFKIEASSATGVWSQVATAGANATSAAGLSPAANAFRVRAYNAAGDSGYSNEASAPVAKVTPFSPNVYTEPANVSVGATASDPDGLARVEFFYATNGTYPNYTLLSTDTSAPYTHDWQNVPAGNYYVKAVAYDLQGSKTDTASESFVVNRPPTGVITSPAGGARFAVGSNVPVRATVQLHNGNGEYVRRVDLYANNTLVGTVEGHYAEYSFTWQNAPEGVHQLTARPTSSLELTGTSEPVTVVVGNPGFSISGRVRDSAGAPLYNVKVTLTGGRVSQVFTDAEGNYTFTNLPAGSNYVATPSASGYAFAPASQGFDALTGPQLADFAGTPTGPAPDPNAVPTYRQAYDGYDIAGPSSKIPSGQQVDGEVADDFDMTAEITRVRVHGNWEFNEPPNPVYYGVFVRFYDGAAGSPGALQAEYYMPKGAPGVSFDAARPSTFDILLPQSFNASGRHFLVVQPVFGGSKTWWVRSANGAQVRGVARHTRDRLAGTPWTTANVTSTYTDSAFDLFGTLRSAPRIDSLSPNPVTRSGLVRVSGAHFGATQGASQLKIGGRDPVYIVSWADDLIVAYVPEQTAVGTVPVAVTTASGTATASLNVTARLHDGRIRWRFTVAAGHSPRRAAIGPDSTVYLNDVKGRLYALTPDGGLKWVFQTGLVGASGPVSVGADGTVYVGGLVPKDPATQCESNTIVNVEGIFAVNPDGTQKWLFNKTCDGLLSGPNVGPDGKIHAVTDSTGIGAFSLNPDGTLAHAPTGRFGVDGSDGTEIVFGPAAPGAPPTQKYFQYESGGLFGYTLDGQRVFLYETNAVGTTQPVAGQRTGTIYTSPDHLTAGRFFAVSPQGALRWVSPIRPISSLSVADAPPSESAVYVVQDGFKLHRLSPADGSVVWSFVDNNESLFDPIASPDDRLVLLGGRVTYGEPGFFEAVSSDGRQLWKQRLPDEPGLAPYGQVVPYYRARFTDDGQTAYAAAHVAGADYSATVPAYSFFYALDTSAADVPVNQPPQATLVSPLDGSFHAKNTAIEVKARVTDDGAVARVEFFRNLRGTTLHVGTDTTPDADGNYSVTFTPDSPDTFGLFAVAYDAGGLSDESNLVGIFVGNELPRVEWVSPVGGEAFPQGAAVTLTARASDPDGTVSKVEFYSGKVGLIGTDTTPDAEGNYSVTFQSAAPDGTHELVAWATDDSGYRGAASITITVVSDAPPPTPTPAPTPAPTPTPASNPPTVRITAPADNSSFLPGTEVTVSAEATDSDGTIARVDFFSEPWGTNVCSDVNAPYSCTFTWPDERLFDVVAVARDNSGVTGRSAPVRVLFERAEKVSISGRIRHNTSQPGNEVFMPNVLVTLKMSFIPFRETRTDAQGNYRFDGLSYGGDFEVVPSLAGYQFSPPASSWMGITSDQTYDFTATGPPPGPAPTPTPGASVLAWERAFNSAHGLGDFDPLVATDAQGNVYVTGSAAVPGDRGDTDIVTVKYAPDGAQLWAKTFAGPGTYKDWPTDVAVDPQGNVYVTGTSWRGSAFSYDLITLKYDSAGTEQWARYRNGPLGDSDFSNALAIDGTGDVIVTGYERTGDNTLGRRFDRFVTVKYGADGTERWAAVRTQAQLGDHAVDVAVDSANNVYVTGFAWTAVGGNQNKDLVTVKYSPAGAELWGALHNGRPGTPTDPQPDGPVADEPGGVRVDASGNVYVFGSNVPGTERDDFLLLKYNPQTGALVWGRNWTGPAYDYARDLAIDASGNLYLTGESYDVVFQTVRDNPTSDVATVKFDPAGNLVWERFYRAFPGKWDGGREVEVDAAGNVYVGAYSEGFVNSDTAVIKYDAAGVERWVYRYGNPQHTNDQLSDMAADAAGNLYLAGDAPFGRQNQQGGTIETLDFITAKLGASNASGLNVPPEVSVTAEGSAGTGAPTALAAFSGAVSDAYGPTITGRTVLLRADAFDSDGTVARVDFYNGTSLLGSDTAAPYTFQWENVEPGTYAITATATDNSGATRTALTEQVTVVAAQPTPTPTPAPGGARINVAAASNGGVATASTTTPNGTFPGYNFSPSVVINGDRRGGLNFWRDNTANAYPDWVEVAFNGQKTINEVGVFSVQDNTDTNPVEPTEVTTFNLFGLTDFEVQYWTGSAWAPVPDGQITGNNKVWRKISFADITTSKIRVQASAALNSYSRLVELEAWGVSAEPPPPPPPTTNTNYALASNGGVATASTTTPVGAFPGYNFSPAVTNDGDRRSGANFWRDNTDSFPDWLRVDFNGAKDISEISVFTLQDNDANPSDPTEAMTFSLNGITDFEVQYWDGSSWQTVPGGQVTGNSLVWRRFTFPSVNTTAVRIVVSGALASRSRIVEVEAWGAATAPPPPPTTQVVNFALASNGGFATASTTTPNAAFPGYNFSPSVTNDGDRKSGVNFWRDNTDAFPDWLQVDFSGEKTVTEVDVFTLQDNDANPSDPTEAMTFTLNGVTDFEVQYWTGAAWAAVPNGVVTGNGLVWRRLTFSPVTTSRIRVVVNGALAGRSRIVEVEAWGEQTAPPPPAPPQGVNHALASNGGVATASTTTPNGAFPGYNFLPSVTNDGDRKSGVNFWRDNTDAFPDWLQVSFSGQKAITEVDVFTLQDNDANPSDPTEAMTFTLNGITDFEVQYWDGAAWETVPDGAVVGNDKVWRRLTFPAVTTDRVRVRVNGALAGRSRIVEVEAWGPQ